MKNILITGATGFLGQSLLKHFSKEYNIKCLIETKDQTKLSFKTIKGNLNNQKILDTTTKNIHTIIHLASIINSNNKKDFLETNIKGTQNLINSAIKNKVKKIIYISSYDVVSKEKSWYSLSKLKAEEIIKKSKINYTILRPTVIYGKGDKKSLGLLFNIIKKSPFIPIFGTGNYQLQPVHVDDVSKSIISALNPKKSNQTYFIAGPNKLSFNQLINITSQTLNKKLIKIHVPLWILKIPLKIYQTISKNPKITYKKLKIATQNKTCNITKTQKDLNFQPITFHQGLKKTLF